MIREDGVVTGLSWVKTLLNAPVKARSKAKKLVLEAIKIFKKGKPSDEGDDLYALLTSKNVKFVGFTPNITYIKEKSEYRDELSALWCHPFSTYSLLYKHSDLPILIIANPNLEFNESCLKKISANSNIKELRNMLGITG